MDNSKLSSSSHCPSTLHTAKSFLERTLPILWGGSDSRFLPYAIAERRHTVPSLHYYICTVLQVKGSRIMRKPFSVWAYVKALQIHTYIYIFFFFGVICGVGSSRRAYTDLHNPSLSTTVDQHGKCLIDGREARGSWTWNKHLYPKSKHSACELASTVN